MHALNEFHLLPSVFVGLPRKEKAAVIAMIDKTNKLKAEEYARIKKK